MHDMPNIEEAGDSAAICNCCSCACFGLRAGLMFGARDAIRSNFVAEVDEAKCVACAQCVENCPANALKLGQKLCSSEELPVPEYASIVNTFKFKNAFNPDYRENREDVLPTGTAPCKTACPAHIAVQGYLKLAAQGRYKDALELIKKENPFPAVCGRICNKRCEAECTRGGIDEAVAIDEVKRFIADHDLNEDTRYIPPMINQIGRPYEEKIAVIGAGPAGMSCAYYLANKGYPVTVFDRNPVPGGMLVLGIPNFRLEKDVLNAEIDILKEMGVEFKCGVEVGKDVTIQQLREQGYKGFYLAIGAQKSSPLKIKGEDLEGVYGGVEFLREVNLGARPDIGKKCAVIGGGNVAMDVCRTAVRLGADETTIIYRRSEAELPADPDEVKEAISEGVKFRYLCAPAEITGKDGKVKQLMVEIMELGAPDEKGRRKPVGTGKYEFIDVDSVISAIGQQVDWGGGKRADLPDRRARHFRRRRRVHRPQVCHRRHRRRQGGRHLPAPLCPSRPDPHHGPRPPHIQGARQGARAHLPRRLRHGSPSGAGLQRDQGQNLLRCAHDLHRGTGAQGVRKNRCARSAQGASDAARRRWMNTCASAAACAPPSASSTPSGSRRCATGTPAPLRPCPSRSPRVLSSVRARSSATI